MKTRERWVTMENILPIREKSLNLISAMKKNNNNLVKPLM
jgi:hypothetical protein